MHPLPRVLQRHLPRNQKIALILPFYLTDFEKKYHEEKRKEGECQYRKKVTHGVPVF